MYFYGNVIFGIINELRNEYKFFIFIDECGFFMCFKFLDSFRSVYNGLVKVDSIDSIIM